MVTNSNSDQGIERPKSLIERFSERTKSNSGSESKETDKRGSSEQFIEGPLDHLASASELAKHVKTKIQKYSASKKSSAITKDFIVDWETKKKVENILEEGLFEAYSKMSKDKQKKFKSIGEEISFKITIMVQQLKVHASKIVNLIKDWLHLIPGVDRFFLEQEAKIKTDKILAMVKNKEKKI